MTLVRVRRAAQLTLPTELRKILEVKEGDLLEAQVLNGGLFLKPVHVVDRSRNSRDMTSYAAAPTAGRRQRRNRGQKKLE